VAQLEAIVNSQAFSMVAGVITEPIVAELTVFRALIQDATEVVNGGSAAALPDTKSLAARIAAIKKTAAVANNVMTTIMKATQKRK